MDQNTMYQRSASASVIETNKVLRNTYMLLSMTLAFSALMCFVTMAMGMGYPNIFVLLVGFYGLMFLVHKTQNSPFGIVATFLFTGFLGGTLGPVIGAFIGAGAGDIVLTALGGTAVTFLACSAYVLTTKKDMSFMGGMMMALFVVLIVGFIANLFLNIPALNLAMSALFILFSSGAILMKTSEIIHGGETNYINATVTLYVAIYNIFVSLLNILTALGGDD